MTDDTLERWRRFWHRAETGRPLWGISLGFFVNEAYPRTMAKMAPGPVRPEDLPLEEFLRDCEDRAARHQDMGDLPCAWAPFPGIPWLEAMAGCRIMASPTSFWAEPCCTDIREWRPAGSAVESGWGRRLREVMQALVERSRGLVRLSPTLMRGPLDIVSAVRGAVGLVFDLLDQPEAVHVALQEGARIWREAADLQLGLIPESARGYVALDSALRCWAPDRLLWLQEDATALLSPDLYRRHVLAVDRQLSDSYPCVAFHLHGSALWAVDELVELPGVDVMELNFEDAFCDVEGTFEGWRKIQRRKPLVVWRKYGPDFPAWLERVYRELSPRGLSVQVNVKDVSEAREVRRQFIERESMRAG